MTEDIHTSIRLHARGWRIVYHPGTLAYGIAPPTLQAFAVQRLRWAQGTMQILRSRENPLLVPGLTLAQRLNYVASMSTYFDAFQKLIYLLTPAIILLTGVLPLRVGAWDFLAHWLPYLALSMLANVTLGRGQFRYLRVEQYNLLKMFTFIWASTVLVWPRRLRFRVTPKEAGPEVAAQEWRLLAPHAVALGLVLVAMALGVVNLARGLDVAASKRDVLLVTLFWALANAGILASGMAAVLRRLHYRRRYRFPAQLGAAAADRSGLVLLATTEDLSQD
ncbi:MAG: glycosyltransferase, partial [Thermomicrobiaceae bacterium]|nr:glycosyltransferase [Thermomicrobiaceae bacterium]